MSQGNRFGCVLYTGVMCISLVSTALTDTFGSGVNQFSIDFVTISDATNPTNGIPAGNGYVFTGVDYDFRIGIYEITNDQWNKFKIELGVPVTGAPLGAYDQEPYWTNANVPVGNVSWCEAAQFVNWLNTSTGHQAAYKFTGTQGQSDYTFDLWGVQEAVSETNLHRHKDAFYFLPNEDEWVKAAYWNGTTLQTYSTPDNSLPIEDIEANYDDFDETDAQPWNVGSGSMELNGTFDMEGNVREWMENHSGFYTTERVERGGSYCDIANLLEVTDRYVTSPYTEYGFIGFRIASNVPEPATLLLLGLGGLAILRRRLLRD